MTYSSPFKKCPSHKFWAIEIAMTKKHALLPVYNSIQEFVMCKDNYEGKVSQGNGYMFFKYTNTVSKREIVGMLEDKEHKIGIVITIDGGVTSFSGNVYTIEQFLLIDQLSN